MKRFYNFNMEDATKEFEIYKHNHNPSLTVSGINIVAHKEEYKQMFMIALENIFTREKMYVETKILNMQTNYDKLKLIFEKTKIENKKNEK